MADLPPDHVDARAATLLPMVQALLVDELELPVSPDALDADDTLHGPPIGLDSLGYLRLVSALETTFRLRLDDATHGRVLFRTVGDVARTLAERGA